MYSRSINYYIIRQGGQILVCFAFFFSFSGINNVAKNKRKRTLLHLQHAAVSATHAQQALVVF